MSTSLIPLEDNKAIEAFKNEGGLEPLLSAIEAECRAQPQVLNTKNGRENIASLAYKIARTKTFLDDFGSKLNAPYQAEIDRINAGRKLAKTRLQALQDEIRAPLTKWEAEEKVRIAAHEEKLKWIESLIVWGADMPKPITSAMIQGRIDLITSDARDWQEYATRAEKVKAAALEALRADLETTAAAEAEAAETAEWLAMYAAAEQENREHDMKRAAARAARELAEAAAAVEIVWAEAHRENAEFDQRQAEARAEAARWASIYAEADSENAEFDRRAQAEAERKKAHVLRIGKIILLKEGAGALHSAVIQARIDQIADLYGGHDWQEFAEEAEKAKEESLGALGTELTAAAFREAEAKKAAEDEAIAAAAADARAAEAERERNRAHKNRINGEACDALAAILEDMGDAVGEDTADWAFVIVEAISEGRIPNVKITY